LEYQFVHQCTNWEPMGHHFYNQPGLQCGIGRDTVDVWWNDENPNDFTSIPVKVRFRVNMREAQPQPTAADTVALAGGSGGGDPIPPLAWDIPSSLYMKDDGVAPDAQAGDSVYTIDVVFPAGTLKKNAIDYKHQYNRAGFAPAWECSTQFNRSFFLDDINYSEANPQVLDIGVFGFCSLSSRDVKVRFQVSGSHLSPVPGDSFHVNGSVAPLTWDVPSVNAMFDDGVPPDVQAGDYIYTLDVVFPESSSVWVDYKYLFNAEYECTTGTWNRNFVIDHLNYSTGAPQILYIAAFNYCGQGAVDEEHPEFARATMTLKNFPNPFNPKTAIAFSIPKEGHVDLAIYDVSGRRVSTLVSETLRAGPHTVTWDGTDAVGARAASGLYFAVLKTAEGQSTRKMVLIK